MVGRMTLCVQSRVTLHTQNRMTLAGFLELTGLTFQSGGVGDQTGQGILPEGGTCGFGATTGLGHQWASRSPNPLSPATQRVAACR